MIFVIGCTTLFFAIFTISPNIQNILDGCILAGVFWVIGKLGKIDNRLAIVETQIEFLKNKK